MCSHLSYKNLVFLHCRPQNRLTFMDFWTKMKVTEILFVFILIIYQAKTKDVCTKNAILKRSEEVYMSKETKHEIEYEFTDFLITMDKIKSSKGPFISEISEYATLEQLKAIALPNLIPFNNRVNLIFINDTATKIIQFCSKLKATVFSFESQKEISEMAELMNDMGLDQISFTGFVYPLEVISRISQKFLFKTPDGTLKDDVQKAKLVVMNRNLSIIIKHKEVETMSNGFCSVPASPFSSIGFDEFEMRSWVKLVGQSQNSLKLFDKLYSDLKENLDTIKEEARGSTRSDKTVTWTVPAEVLRAHEFVTHHDHDKAWDSSTGDILYELSQFVEDMRSINDFISERLRIESRKLIIYPRYETEGHDGMSMRQIILTARLIDASGRNKCILKGEALGKSLNEGHKVTIYKGYSHGMGGTRPVDSIIVEDGANYRAVTTFEELGWECTISKAKKVCASGQGYVDENQIKCGEFFFGKSDRYKDCPQTKVDKPMIYGSFCGNENEVLSSYYMDYKLGLWCNGYLAENLDLKAGLSTILTKCEVRSEDGQTTYSHQVGANVERNVMVTKLGSYLKSEVDRIIEDVLGWPATGTIIGTGSLVILFIIALCVKIIGIARCKRFFINNTRTRGPRAPAGPEMIPLQGRGPSLHVYNFNADRGQIVPRELPFRR